METRGARSERIAPAPNPQVSMNCRGTAGTGYVGSHYFPPAFFGSLAQIPYLVMKCISMNLKCISVMMGIVNTINRLALV